MHDLAALGFGPKTISKFTSQFPGGTVPAGLSLITRDYLTEGQIHYNEILFSGPVIQGFKAANAAERAAHFAKMTARGEVVQQVAVAYLRAVADQSEVENAKALVAQAQVFADHAHDAHVGGIEANLDELRAKVQLQSQQQGLIAAENQQAKDLILLKREIGVDPEQVIELTDPAPYSELAEQTPEEVKAVAYQNRQDYQNLPKPGGRVQGAAQRVSQRAAAHAELQRQLRHQHRERRGHARRFPRHGDFDLPHLPRGQAARRRGRVKGEDARDKRAARRSAQFILTSRCARRSWM